MLVATMTTQLLVLAVTLPILLDLPALIRSLPRHHRVLLLTVSAILLSATLACTAIVLRSAWRAWPIQWLHRKEVTVSVRPLRAPLPPLVRVGLPSSASRAMAAWATARRVGRAPADGTPAACQEAAEVTLAGTSAV